MGMIVRLIGGGIGLASEAIHKHKSDNALKKQADEQARNAGEGSSSSSTAPQPYPDEAPPQYVEVPEERGRVAAGQALQADSNTEYPDEKAERNPYLAEGEDDASSEEEDEEAWQLDEAQRELVGGPSNEQPKKEKEDVKSLVDKFLSNHPPPAYGQRAQLPCPVILPQRRPRDKKRGFVRAYAPVLEDCGIDQATFLEFLETFEAASLADMWLQVINMSAGVVGFVPGPITMGISMSVQVTVGIAMEVQRRSRSNSFLDRMNNDFFKPRGLYCLVMTYKPDSSVTHERIDIDQTIKNYSAPDSNNAKQIMRNLRGSSGKTYGEIELPEAAPLVFPALDRLANDNTEAGEQKKSSMKSAGQFCADYMDRRAQGRYLKDTPGSKLAIGEGPQFTSRYADPNHPASSGSIISLLTGGNINPKTKRDERRVARREKRAYRRGEPITEQTGKRKDGIVKRVLKKDVLYLMIVNLPSEAEAQVGRSLVANEEQAQGQVPPQYRY